MGKRAGGRRGGTAQAHQLVSLGHSVHKELYEVFKTRASLNGAAGRLSLGKSSVKRWAQRYRENKLKWDGKRLVSTASSAGRPTKLSDDVERDLVTWVRLMGSQSASPTVASMTAAAARLATQAGEKPVTLSDRWYVAFFKRHPELELAAKTLVEPKFGVPASLDDVGQLFSNMEWVAAQNEGKEAVVSNMDEGGIEMPVDGRKVVIQTGAKGAHRVISKAKTTGEHLTVCGAIATNQEFHMMIPQLYIVSKGIKVEPHEFQPHPTGSVASKVARIVQSDTGWMTKKLFVKWCRLYAEAAKQFLKDRPNKYIVLLIDFASSHLCAEAFEVLKDAGVWCVMIPPRGTADYQPLDVGVYYPFKQRIRTIVRGLTDNGGKITWPSMIRAAGAAWESAATPTIIADAFAKTGLHPLKLPAKVLMASEPNRWLRLDYDVGNIVRDVANGKVDLYSTASNNKNFTALLQLMADIDRDRVAAVLADLVTKLSELGSKVPVPAYDQPAVNPYSNLRLGGVFLLAAPVAKQSKRRRLQKDLMATPVTQKEAIEKLRAAEAEKEAADAAAEERRVAKSEKLAAAAAADTAKMAEWKAVIDKIGLALGKRFERYSDLKTADIREAVVRLKLSFKASSKEKLMSKFKEALEKQDSDISNNDLSESEVSRKIGAAAARKRRRKRR